MKGAPYILSDGFLTIGVKRAIQSLLVQGNLWRQIRYYPGQWKAICRFIDSTLEMEIQRALEM